MEIGLTFAIEMLIKTISEFNPEERFEILLTNAEMIRESAAVIANATEEEIIDALKERKKRTR